MSTNRNLKAFVRYDGSGRVVAGSLILRKNKPKVGNFQLVQGYQCCNHNQKIVAVSIESSFPIAYVDFLLQVNTGNPRQSFSIFTNQTAADVPGLLDILNANAGQFGQFTLNYAGDGIELHVNEATGALFVSTDLVAYTFAD